MSHLPATKRDYVFRVTISCSGDAPKPDAHELRSRLVSAILEGDFPEDLLVSDRTNSVTFQVQCTGKDCRNSLPEPKN